MTAETAYRYDKAWFDSLAKYREWNERAMWAILATLGKPSSMVDLGCGDAWMVRTARMAGVKPSLGVEVSRALKLLRPLWASVYIADLRLPLVLNRKYDLVVSVETAEHLEPEYADTYVDNVVNHCAKWLVFTAAIPGQNGEGHVNCQPKEYWQEKFEAKGLIYSGHYTYVLAEAWKWATGPMFWLPQNVQVFKGPDNV